MNLKIDFAGNLMIGVPESEADIQMLLLQTMYNATDDEQSLMLIERLISLAQQNQNHSTQ